MDRVLEKIFRVGSGTDWVRVLVSNIESIGYYRVLKILIGYLSVFSIISHILLLNIYQYIGHQTNMSNKHVFGGMIWIFIGSNRSSLRHSVLLQVWSATSWNFHLAQYQCHTNHSGLALMQLKTMQCLTRFTKVTLTMSRSIAWIGKYFWNFLLFHSVEFLGLIILKRILWNVNGDAKYSTFTIQKGDMSKVWRYF